MNSSLQERQNDEEQAPSILEEINNFYVKFPAGPFHLISSLSGVFQYMSARAQSQESFYKISIENVFSLFS